MRVRLINSQSAEVHVGELRDQDQPPRVIVWGDLDSTKLGTGIFLLASHEGNGESLIATYREVSWAPLA